MKTLSTVQTLTISGAAGSWDAAAARGFAEAFVGSSYLTNMNIIYAGSLFSAGALSLFAAQQTSLTRRDAGFTAIGAGLSSLGSYLFGGSSPVPVPAANKTNLDYCMTHDCKI